MRIKLAGQIALVIAAGLLLAGCYSHHRTEVMSEPAGAQPATSTWEKGTQPSRTVPQASEELAQPPATNEQQQLQTQPQPQEQQPSSQLNQGAQPTAQNEVIIPLHQETAQVGKRTVNAGQVTIHKKVTTETVQQPVELRNESVSISREPAGAAAPSTQAHGESALSQPFQEGAITIQLQKEEPVVQKNTVVSGDVVARKNAQMQQQTVQTQVRRETVQVDKSPDAQNVVISGNLGAPVAEAAGAQTAQQGQQTAGLAQDPQKFLDQAYQEAQTEIQLGQLAQQKAQSPAVKQFAQKLVQDFQAVDQKLSQLAQQKGIQLSNKLDATHQAIIDQFSNLSPTQFEQQFSNQLISMQQKAVNLFDQVAKQASDKDIKNFAQNSLQTIRQQLQMAQSQLVSGEAAGAQAQPQQQQPQIQQDQQQQQQPQQTPDQQPVQQ